ncbi:hypothetical protein C0V97_11695 [Asaia sp. W19]|uniref:hypothetical protein n=1 Tax=unclassified Asaia TaxID=2685023 RepID=UPI000F8DA069|nr:hypothetical protein [Asaia sp. W19]RUT25251.1 hypothetical protein C0V97_11695 [Asaia sp. W19]
MQPPAGTALPQAQASADGNASAPQGNPGQQDAPDNGTNRLIAPDITTAMVGSIPFGGHTLPLPAGIWHPVLTGQYGPGGQMLINILVRTDRGVVTGVIVARTATEQLPIDIVQQATSHCHDDRNYSAQIFADRADGRSECAFVANAVMGPNGVISSDELIQLAFKRLSALGFPMPSLFIVANWIQSSGAMDSNKGTSAVTYLLSPTKTGTVQLLAPQPYWDKATLAQVPSAETFVRKTDRWLNQWIPLLRRYMTQDTTTTPVPVDLSRDPAAPPQ